MRLFAHIAATLAREIPEAPADLRQQIFIDATWLEREALEPIENAKRLETFNLAKGLLLLAPGPMLGPPTRSHMRTAVAGNLTAVNADMLDLDEACDRMRALFGPVSTAKVHHLRRPA